MLPHFLHLRVRSPALGLSDTFEALPFMMGSDGFPLTPTPKAPTPAASPRQWNGRRFHCASTAGSTPTTAATPSSPTLTSAALAAAEQSDLWRTADDRFSSYAAAHRPRVACASPAVTAAGAPAVGSRAWRAAYLPEPPGAAGAAGAPPAPPEDPGPDPGAATPEALPHVAEGDRREPSVTVVVPTATLRAPSDGDLAAAARESPASGASPPSGAAPRSGRPASEQPPREAGDATGPVLPGISGAPRTPPQPRDAPDAGESAAPGIPGDAPPAGPPPLGPLLGDAGAAAAVPGAVPWLAPVGPHECVPS